MADLIILPFKAGTLSSSSLPAILDSDSLRACHARPLISHQYISKCVQQKAQLHIKAYRIDLAAPSAGSSDDRGAGSKSWRTSESYAADLCTPESMTDRHPKVEDRPSSNGGREWNQAAAGRSWEVERKGEEVIRVSPSDDDLEEGSEYGEEDELDSEADVSVPLKSEVKSSLSNPPTSDSAKPASARPPKVRQLSTVRPEDEADYIWLKSRIKAWDFLGSRTRFLESLNTIVSYRTARIVEEGVGAEDLNRNRTELGDTSCNDTKSCTRRRCLSCFTRRGFMPGGRAVEGEFYAGAEEVQVHAGIMSYSTPMWVGWAVLHPFNCTHAFDLDVNKFEEMT